jgi:hypothetical protein
MGMIGTPETSVPNHLTPRNNPEYGRISFIRDGSLRSYCGCCVAPNNGVTNCEQACITTSRLAGDCPDIRLEGSTQIGIAGGSEPGYSANEVSHGAGTPACSVCFVLLGVFNLACCPIVMH